MENFRIRPLSESDLDSIIKDAGGERADVDAHTRGKPGSDYLLHETIIELKALDEEGLAKPERQQKLAALFLEHNPTRPVIVLDREALSEQAKRVYDRILDGPVKTAVAKAKGQLKQSRVEHPAATTTILFVINNGYTALDHKTLVRMVAHRVRQDTREIDGVVVAGCYFYSDTFDSYFLWPIDYIPVNISRPFTSFDKLSNAWNRYAVRFMTNVVQGENTQGSNKGPVIDVQFDIDGVRFVWPAPPMGGTSTFFETGRPRQDSTGLDECPAVALTFPGLSQADWIEFRNALPQERALCDFFEEWQAKYQRATNDGTALKPVESVPITYAEWKTWCTKSSVLPSMSAIRRYTNEVFTKRVLAMVSSSRERTSSSVLPIRYILVNTEEIGQDCANDVSHIFIMSEMPNREAAMRELIVNARIFHNHALALAAAYAVQEGIDFVLWTKNRRYAWV